jgi:hypothetical protein
MISLETPATNLDRYLQLLDPDSGLTVEELQAVFGLDVYKTPIAGFRYLRFRDGRSTAPIHAALEDPNRFALAPVFAFAFDKGSARFWAPNEPQLLAGVREYHDLDPNVSREALLVIAPTLAALRSMP